MARKHSNPLDDPPAATSSEEHDEVEESEEEEEEEDEQQQLAQPEGSDTEEVVEEEEEDEDEDEEDDEDDDDEEEEGASKDKGQPQPSQSKPLSKIPNPQQDDDDTETESDTDTKSPGVSAFTIRPHPSKPAAATPNSPTSVKPKKAAAKPSSVKESASSMVVSLKRPTEAEESKSKVKKPKVENGGVEEGVGSEKKGGSVNRLWNEHDEIAILKGMIEFYDNTGVDPNSDSVAFHEFMKKNLSVDVLKSQLMDKVRRLKKKYKSNTDKGEKGQDPVFNRPHDVKAYELSKKIWGGGGLGEYKRTPKKKIPDAKPITKVAADNGNAAVVTSPPKEKTVIAVSIKQEQGKDQQERSFSELYPFLSISMKQSNGADLISKDWVEAMECRLKCLKKSELEKLDEEWKKQILAEVDVTLGRSVLMQKQIQVISDWRMERG